MPRYYLTSLVVLSLFNLANAKSLADCRVVTGGTTECNPYASKFLHAKEINYSSDRKKLIISKTLPLPEKAKVRVISIEEMIEKYVKVEDSLRFKRTHEDMPTIKVIAEPVPPDAVKRIVEKPPKDLSKKEVSLEKIVKVNEVKTEQVQVKEKIIRKEIILGYYKVVSGDSLGRVANKFELSVKELLFLNNLDKKKPLKLGRTLRIPLPQDKIDAMAKGEYIVEASDSLITIAGKFNVSPKELAEFNAIKTNTTIRVGKKLALPLPYMLKKRAVDKKRLAVKQKQEAAKKAKAKAKRNKLARKTKKLKMMRGIGKRKLRVTATAYSSHKNQTDSTPFLAAWNNRLRPGMKIIAVSRDMLTRYGMRNGTKVRIGGLRGYYTVRDKMNKRYRKRIDIYMGVDRRRALRWGRRSVVIYW